LTRATDINGRVTLSDVRTITVNNAAPVVSITSPANGATFNPATLPLFLTIQAVATDSDDAITKVELYDNGTASKNLIAVSAHIGGAQNPNYSFSTVLPPGVHKLVAKAYDPYGVTTSSAPVQITVGNALPTVTLTSPTNGASVKSPPTITLTAVATDTDDTISEVDFLDGGSIVAAVKNTTNIVNNTYSFTLVNVPNGSHTYTAVASDVFGGSAVSSSATVTVNNAAPTVTLVGLTNGITFSYPVNVQVHAIVSDADDGVQKVTILLDNAVVSSAQQIGGGVLTTSDFFATLNNLSIGAHTLTVTAVDPYGATTTTSIAVNVSIQATPIADQPASSSSSGSQADSSSSTASGAPAISSLVSLPDGGYQLTITGSVGAKATVQSSGNFADWTTLATVVVGSNGTVQYTDTNAGGGRRFYRLGQ
jgi:hypothetical protein